MLERAVSNLVSNADKFSPPGAPISIVSADGQGQRARFRTRHPGCRS